jgi:hypothetical protein
MSVTVSEVFLRDGTTGELVSASLYDSILPRHLDHHEQHWQPLIADQAMQHGHWDWRAKIESCSGQLRFQSFAIECAQMTQGLMIVNTVKRCRLPSQFDKRLVYIEYLEAAPWNRSWSRSGSSYKGVGTVLIAAAIQLSQEQANRGRIGLHSLPQADTFYRNQCGMTDLGPDPSYPEFPLRYFEMTEAQAAGYLKGKSG